MQVFLSSGSSDNVYNTVCGARTKADKEDEQGQNLEAVFKLRAVGKERENELENYVELCFQCS